jgi:hypothetical protein
MKEAKNQISSIRRISANVLAPLLEWTVPNPLTKTKIKPNQFIGALDLLKYKPVTVQVDVSNLKPPLEYYFRYPPAGELNIWFSSRAKPTQEKHDVCISNRQQWTFESPGKLPKNETHYFTFEA